jgi:predicted dithiol-disulfide oxidoreductase (DUF899 family)
MCLPQVVSREEWLTARKALLDTEKMATRARDTTLVQVSRAPHDRLERDRARHGWTIPWYSSHGTDFNADFGVTVGDPPRERAGLSCFLRDGGSVYHTYSTYDRGLEAVAAAYAYLDLTALGRQEDWEKPARVSRAAG